MKLRLALLGAPLFAGILFADISNQTAFGADTLTNATLKEPVPVFQVDTNWPQLPNNWVLGLVASIRIDSHGNIWLIHRPRTVEKGTPAPSVIEFGPDGKYKQAWGGPNWGGTNPGFDWPDTEHNVLVDAKDNVFISGSSPSGQSKTTRSDDMILKFTVDGKFIKEFGGRDVSKGSTDHNSVNKPGDFYIWPKTGEMFISDGYGNRRVLVLDPDTFAFKREWGAFGKPPVDVPGVSGGPGSSGGPRPQASQAGVETTGGGRGGGGGGGGARAPLDTTGPGPDMFASPVHGIIVSNDGIVYVADRSNRRLQLFTPDGKYLTQMFLNRAGPAVGSVTGMTLSPDADQKYLYLSDYGNSHIAVVDRKSLQVLYQFGVRGKEPGNFQGVHLITTDAKGNIYAAEVAPGARAQRFLFKGMSNTLPPNALTPEQLEVKPAAGRQ
jgi:hypothetical protein